MPGSPVPRNDERDAERQEKLRDLARVADGIREKSGRAALGRPRLLPTRAESSEDADGSEEDGAEASSLPSVD